MVITDRGTFLLLLVAFCYGLAMAMAMAMGLRDEKDQAWWSSQGEGEEMINKWKKELKSGSGSGSRSSENWFLLRDSKNIVKTDEGTVRVVRTMGNTKNRPMHIGFITMEPNTLFIPQYLDSSLILFLHRGQARLGYVCNDELTERQLGSGDVYRIPAGSAFYLENTGEGRRLEIISSIDASDSFGMGLFQSFFIGGGTYPTSVLAGFEPETLTTSFNVSMAEIRSIMSKTRGPFVRVNKNSPSTWTKFLKQKQQDRLQHLKRIVETHREDEISQVQEQPKFSWRKLLESIIGQKINDDNECPEAYNLYDKNPDFSNNYGSSIALESSDYRPLRHAGIGVYLVNLTAGSMMAPHVNPVATEYGIVLRGTGRIQIVHPNGTSAMNANVNKGDVFWVPRYFAFCQIASRSGPFEFFGFTSSAHRNRPQFLAGANSLLHTLNGPELAASLGVSEERVQRVLEAQHESVILPAPAESSIEEMERMKAMEKLEKLKNVGVAKF